MRDKSKISFLKINSSIKKALKFSSFLLIAFLLFSGGNVLAKNINFGVAGDNILLNGSVGIGITNPGYKLDVSGDANISGRLKVGATGILGPNLSVRDDVGISAPWTSVSGTITNGLRWYNYQGIESANILYRHNDYFGATVRQLEFGLSGNTLMTILNNGNVGIGTTASGNRLTVTKDIGSDDVSGSQHALQLQVEKATQDGGCGKRSLGIGVMDNGNSVLQSKQCGVGYNNILLNPVSGNVGIGMTAPAYKLDVNGYGNFNSNAIHNVGTPSVDSDVATQGYVKSSVSGGNLWGGTLNGNIWNGAAGAGSVGIGTNAPTNRLLVLNGTANTSGDSLTTATAQVTGPNWVMDGTSSNGTFLVSTNDLMAANLGGSIGFAGRYNGSAQATWSAIKGAKEDGVGGQYGGYMAFGTRAHGTQISEKMRIAGNGNVGIGTTAPSYSLQVSGPGTPTINITGSTGQLYVNNISPNTGSNIYMNANVGIGTASPGARLTVSGAANSDLMTLGTASGIFGALSANGLYGLYTGVSNDGHVWMQVGRNDASAATYPLTINPGGGNVGIGNSAPSYKLDVAGNGAFRSGDNSYIYFGPNASWGGSLYVGATPNKIGSRIAQVVSSDGNLHIDSGNYAGNDIYLNYYNSGHGIRAFGPLNMNSNQINGLGTPTSASDAATKGYVDSASVGNADTVDSLHAASFFQYQGFTLDANTMSANRSGFTYAVNAPAVGPIVSFEPGGYGLQLNAPYSGGGTNLYFRTRNGDAGSWNGWKTVITGDSIGAQSVNYAASAGNADTVDGQHFAWSNQNNNPTYLWAADSNGNGYLAWRAGMSVSHADSAASASNASTADKVNGYGGTANNAHPGTGLKPFYQWGGSNCAGSYPSDSCYVNGITIGSHPGDQAYGFQIAQNMWDDRLIFRRYSSGWAGWLTVIDSATIGSQSVNYANSAGSTGVLTGPAHVNGSDGWFRSNGGTGWYNESYGVGVYATQAGRVDLYNGASLYVPGSVTASSYVYSSDQNLKKNIATIQNPLEKILQLRGVTFDWKKDGKSSVGLIAQEVEEIFPELVSSDGTNKGVQYGNLVAPLIEAVKAQQKEIEELKAGQKDFDLLKTRIKNLETKTTKTGVKK